MLRGTRTGAWLGLEFGVADPNPNRNPNPDPNPDPDPDPNPNPNLGHDAIYGPAAVGLQAERPLVGDGR